MEQTTNADRETVLNELTQPVLFAREGELTRCNAAAEALLGADGARLEDILGESLDFYRAYDGKGVMDLTLRFRGKLYDATVRREDGTDVFLAASAPASERLSLETLAVAAQTIRGPLTDLFDAASVLFPMLEDQEDPKIQKQTARLNRGFYKLLRIAGNLSDLRLYLTGEARLDDERTDLRAFFGELAERAGGYCAEAGLRLRCVCPERCFYGSIDRQKVERAVLNLISNAMKFTPAGGEIVLRVERTEHSVLVRVTDTGEGIDPLMMATIFSRYEHREQLGDPRWGVGLGLPLVRMIAQLHGGTVVVRSGPGEGTSVTMSLALRARPAGGALRSPVMGFDYAGGFSHAALELSDALPNEAFDTVNLV